MFTPGGDLIYGIDPTKQEHWHLHLCVGLQEILGLSEPPHFLVPGYTGTIDRWIDPQTQQLRTSAEIYRPIQHHQALLNAVFGMSNLIWQVAPWKEESCDPMVLLTYRDRFPQLWENHDLIVRFDRTAPFSYSYSHEEHYPTLTQRLQETNFAKEYTNPEHFIHTDAWQWSINPIPVSKNSYGVAPKTLIASDNNSTQMDAYSYPKSTHSYVLRLFVSGNSAATEQTLKKLHHLLENSLHYPYTLKVIDVFKHPEQAEANHISATPTLLRVWPQPVRRIVGDLNDVENILRVIIAPQD
ncbi:MAG TPA: circadian clock protein KaiB [Cyanobacteria bacterium UBA11162]|nr:circadian clock protein KaiB [Cyanobacteria bacterium UBA11162]